MKLAIISDIHGNLQALEAVLEVIERQRYDKIICLGDLVGYGPNPNEVIHLIRELEIPTIMGNYDEAVGFLLPSCGCYIGNKRAKYLASNSLKWSIQQTTKENRAYLRSLPEELRLKIENKSLRVTHGTLDSINEYVYENDEERLTEIIERIQEDIFLYGHTHFPFIKKIKHQWVMNGGSVGRPKNGDNRSNFVSLYITKDKVCGQIERIPYDYEKTAYAIEKSGLDNRFADFIRLGGEGHELKEVIMPIEANCCQK